MPLDIALHDLEMALLPLPNHHLGTTLSDAALIDASRSWVEKKRRPSTDAGPVISVLMPTYEPVLWEFAEAIASVLDQTYPRWELCIVDDGSPSVAALELASDICERDDRVRVAAHVANRGIATATNTALAMASGDYVAFLDHDDKLEAHALRVAVEHLSTHADCDVLYSDETLIDSESKPIGLMSKPRWSAQRLHGVMYVGHLLVVRRDLVRAVGGLDSTYDSVQDFELVLRLSERARSIVHVAEPLYCWRMTSRSVTGGGRLVTKDVINTRQVAAVASHFRRRRSPARVESVPGRPHRARVLPPVDWTPAPLDAVIVGGEEAGAAASARLERHAPMLSSISYVADSEVDLWAAVDDSLSQLPDAELVLVMSAAFELRDAQSLAVLQLHAHIDETAIVGPVVIGADGLVLHAGWMLEATPPGVGPAYENFNPTADGYCGELSCAREVSAIAGDVALIRRAFLREARVPSGFRTLRYAVLDLSLQALRRHLRCIVTPASVATARSGKRRAFDSDNYLLDHQLLVDRWRSLLADGDPYAPYSFVRRHKQPSVGNP